MRKGCILLAADPTPLHTSRSQYHPSRTWKLVKGLNFFELEHLLINFYHPPFLPRTGKLDTAVFKYNAGRLNSFKKFTTPPICLYVTMPIETGQSV